MELYRSNNIFSSYPELPLSLPPRQHNLRMASLSFHESNIFKERKNRTNCFSKLFRHKYTPFSIFFCKKKKPLMAVISEGVEGREERRIKHYSSGQHILLVGEGDFSFSLSLATAFESAENIVATSLDSYEELIRKYKNAKSNLAILRKLGASLLHGVDATKMKIFPDLQRQKFHRIIYNFPHAGFLQKENHPELIKMHRDLVRGFLWNASSMLSLDGEIHITHKTKSPFNSWRIEDLGSDCSLFMAEREEFRIQDFPGYQNKRGSGSRCDEPFALGKCKTYKFILYPTAKKIPKTERMRSFTHRIRQNVHIPENVLHQPGLLDGQPPFRSFTFIADHTSNVPRNECLRMFGDYLNHVEESFGSTSHDVYHSVREVLRLSFNMYMGAVPGTGRSLSGYISILEELRQLSILRSERLRQMLVHLEQQL